MKIKTKVVHEIDYGELEKFATEVYDLKDYCFVAVQECRNDTVSEFTVDGEIDDYEREEVAQIHETKDVPCYQNGLLLNMLCRDGYIPGGTYLVDVRW